MQQRQNCSGSSSANIQAVAVQIFMQQRCKCSRIRGGNFQTETVQMLTPQRLKYSRCSFANNLAQRCQCSGSSGKNITQLRSKCSVGSGAIFQAVAVQRFRQQRGKRSRSSGVCRCSRRSGSSLEFSVYVNRPSVLAPIVMVFFVVVFFWSFLMKISIAPSWRGALFHPQQLQLSIINSGDFVFIGDAVNAKYQLEDKNVNQNRTFCKIEKHKQFPHRCAMFRRKGATKECRSLWSSVILTRSTKRISLGKNLH